MSIAQQWMPFDEARLYAQGLDLKTRNEWFAWSKSGSRPSDIPADPRDAYLTEGWQGWGDWLGTGNQRFGHGKDLKNRQHRKPCNNYRAFDEARKYVQTLGLKNPSEWREWANSCVRPDDIPKTPSYAYNDQGWMGFGDWLGTGKIRHRELRLFLSYTEARKFIHSVKLANFTEWAKWSKSDARPFNIPSHPNFYYEDIGWIDWRDWLGTNTTRKRGKNFLPFVEARTIVRSYNFGTKSEWEVWLKTDLRPINIPTNPQKVYLEEGWTGWGDWLGNGRRQQNHVLPFNQAREFVRSLNLKNNEEWREWVEAKILPNNIPGDPWRVYSEQGWQDITDWLGTEPSKYSRRNRQYRSFPEARSYVRSLNLKGAKEWQFWRQTDDRPTDIPTDPARIYKNDGWEGLGDWLGTGNKKGQGNRGNFRLFEDAREFARNLGLKSQAEWANWRKTSNRPNDIPSVPGNTYRDQGWSGWDDWLGVESSPRRTATLISTKAQVAEDFLPFAEARSFSRMLNLKDSTAWQDWAKTSARPKNIPSNPSIFYRNHGWIGFADWLGNGRSRDFLPFEESRKVTRGLGLRSPAEWQAWARTSARPDNIPSNPPVYYHNAGWLGYADWLGYAGSWNKNTIRTFLDTLKPVLPSLTPAELYVIIRQNGFLDSLQYKFGDSHNLMKQLREVAGSADESSRKVALESIIDGNLGETANSGLEALAEITTDELKYEAVEADDLVLGFGVTATDTLKSVDSLIDSGAVRGDDKETIEFLISRKVQWYWEQILQGKTSIQTIETATGGTYFETIRNRFLSQYYAAVELPTPVGFAFPKQPNLMQKLTACRVMQEKRLGNWSGTGSGKTLSAILASRVIDAKFTLIIANNNTIENGWLKAIPHAFPDSLVYGRKAFIPKPVEQKYTYLVLNFESFQQADAASLVHQLLDAGPIDFIVLDEIQMVKQRDDNTSKRRFMVNALITGAAEINLNLHVLGMSATPVVNNLQEAKALLEMILGESFNELKTHATIPNAIALHEKLILHGIRYRPEYNIALDERVIEIPGDLSLIAEVSKAKTPLQIDQLLLTPKIDAMIQKGWLKRGTLIYSYYVSGIVDQLEEAVRCAGFRVGRYTGNDKDGLEAFKSGQVDVLIGSSAVGTGIDGLQECCNRLIVMSLPWTNAEYEQLKGRIYRQGSIFDNVDVIIPQIFLPVKDEVWSWDDIRMSRIKYKRDLASAAVDGYIPEGKLPTEAKMLADAKAALEEWIKRIEQEGVIITVRRRLSVPLPGIEEQNALRKYGEFSHLNARYNTTHSSNTHERLTNEPTEWYHYHTLYRIERKKWEEIPIERIAGELRQCPATWLIGDFGCGEAYLSTQFPNRIVSFDHVAIDDNVIACDMKNTGYAGETLDAAVFSLSLMGSNFPDYLKEASRLLKHRGQLFISEPASRWQGKIEELKYYIRQAGFTILEGQERRSQFIYLDAIKK